ncbi:MAG: hypothetical protein M0P69_01675 [Bacteroidales bacterium]|nr:hypothetical protein [Bacteroidales bacterium]
MNDYEKRREEEKRQAREIHEKLRAAAVILGYTPEEPSPEDTFDPWRTMAHKDGAPDLFFRCGYSDKRVEISGSYPRAQDGTYSGTLFFTPEERDAIKAGTYSGPLAKYTGQYGAIIQPKITVSRDKTAEKIAQGVQRRLLPAITEYYARVMAWIDNHDNYNTTSAATLETIKAAPLTEYEAREFKYSEYTEPKDDRDYGIRISAKASRGFADIEIHNLTAEEAARIVQLAREI